MALACLRGCVGSLLLGSVAARAASAGLRGADGGPPPAAPASPSTAGDSGTMWTGANSYYLWALEAEDIDAVLNATHQAGVKVLRIFVVTVLSDPPEDYPKDGTSAKTYYDIEQFEVGNFDTANASRFEILDKIDDLMHRAYLKGIKLDIALHDRYSLGWDLSDGYVSKYNLPKGKPASQDLSNFYRNAAAEKDFDNRLAFLLQHVNPHFQKPWGMLGEAIFSVGIENEAQGHLTGPSMGVNYGWWCARAKAMRPHVGGGVLISLGGTWNLQSAIDNRENYACPEIDLISVHSYDDPGVNHDHLIGNLITIAKLAKEATPPQRAIFEEFGQAGESQTKRGVVLGQWMEAVSSVGVPFMPWQLMKPGDNCTQCMNFWTSDESWTQLVKWTAAAGRSPGLFAWPELTGAKRAAGLPCASNAECQSGCCALAHDGSSFACSASSGPASLCTGARLRQGEDCTSNGQCESGCCSNGWPKDSNINEVFTCRSAGSQDCTGFYCPYLDGGCKGVIP